MDGHGGLQGQVARQVDGNQRTGWSKRVSVVCRISFPVGGMRPHHHTGGIVGGHGLWVAQWADPQCHGQDDGLATGLWHRTYLPGETVVSKLEENEIFDLVDKAVAKRPYRTSVLVRFFPFPELVKNLALSILPPVQLGVFLAATFTHTFPFTLLWTWLGCDTVAHMRNDTLAPNKILAAVLVGVTAFGVFGSPALAALFVRSMKLEHDRAVAEKKQR